MLYFHSPDQVLFSRNISKKGLEQAKEEINKDADGIQIEIIYEDSKTNPNEGIAAYNKLVNLNQVSVVIVALSSVAKAIAPLATKRNTIQIGIAVAIPNYTNPDKNIFRVYPDAYGMAGVMANYINESLNSKTACVLYINDEFGRTSFEVFEEIFTNAGGEIVVEESYDLLQKDFKSIIAKLNAQNPDVIYLNGYGLAYATFIKQLKESGNSSLLTADMTLGLPSTLKQIGGLLDSVYYVDGQMNQNFISSFQNFQNEPPTSYAGYAYDIIKIIHMSASNADDISTLALKREILNTKNYDGAMGNISIKPNGDSELQFSVKKIIDGKIQ